MWFSNNQPYVGGEGGSSLRNINEGILKIVTMILCIRIKNSNSLLSMVVEAESKKKLGRRKKFKKKFYRKFCKNCFKREK